MVVNALVHKYAKINMITKRNVVRESIGMVLLLLRGDVMHPRHTVSDQNEHIFGAFRNVKRDFTAMKAVEIEKYVEKELVRMKVD